MALTEYGTYSNPTMMVSDGAGGIWGVAYNGGATVGYVSKFNAALSSRTDYYLSPSTFDASASYGGCLGPDGNLWFTDYANNVLMKVTTAGSFTRYTTGFSGKGLCGICTDGTDLFIACLTTDQILKVSTAGTVSSTFSMTAGKGVFQVCHTGGNLYFTCNTTSQIGKCTTAGASISYTATKTASAGPYGICVGPDGLIWYVEEATGVRKIAKISTDMSTTHLDYATGVTSSDPRFICSDGTMLWFTDYGGNRVCSITTSGTVTQNTPTAASSPYGICYYNSKVYFSEYARSSVGSFDTTVSTTQTSPALAATVTLPAPTVTATSPNYTATAPRLTATVSQPAPTLAVALPAQASSPPLKYGSRVTIVDDTAYNGLGGYDVLANGNHLAVYRLGTQHVNNGSTIVGKLSTDGGATWGSAFTIVASPGGNLDVRDAAVCVLTNGANAGRVIVTYYTYNTVTGDSVSKSTYSDNASSGASATWSTPVTIDYGFTYNGGGGSATSGAAVQLANGDVIAAAYYADTGNNTTFLWTKVAKSTNAGVSWSALATVTPYNGTIDYLEPNLAVIRNSSGFERLICLTRRDTGTSSTRMSYSDDSGATWSSSTQVFTDTFQGRPAVKTLPNGSLVVMVRKGASGTAAFRHSSDGGATWGNAIDLSTSNLQIYGGWANLTNSFTSSSPTLGVVYAEEIAGSPSTNADVYYQALIYPQAPALAATVALPTPTVTTTTGSGNATVAAVALTATTRLSAPVLQIGVVAPALAVTATLAVPVITISSASSVTVTASPLTATCTLRVPGISGGIFTRPFTTTLTIQSVTAPLDVQAVTAPLDLTTEAP